MGTMVSASISGRASAVTPSDTADNYFSYLYVGTGGDVVVDGQNGGASITHKNVASGSYIWLKVSKVRATNTTASDIVGYL